jgi:hypothetical protein
MAAMELKNKTILILSPQRWGNMFISKHHYAIALAKRGNKVYFLNPPDDPTPSGGNIDIQPSGIHDNLFIVSQHLYFPYMLKFHALPVFHFLMQWQIKKVLRQLDTIDIAWSFDIGHHYPFKYFPAGCLKIFHPVDEPSVREAITAAGSADIIFSVTHEILDKYKTYPVPRHFINHGLSEEFLSAPTPVATNGTQVHAGFAGNLLRNDIDRDALLSIVTENPAVQFDFWGSYRQGDSNIGGTGDLAQRDFITRLQACTNVTLHGPVPVKELSSRFPGMDVFLICYDVQKDQSKGTNYHKIMEYLAAGKVIVSNNVTTYAGKQELVEMIPERGSNRTLPALFKKVTQHLATYNSPELVANRKSFAKDNTYDKQVERIETCLQQLTH